MKYIDAEKLLAEIAWRKKQDVTFRERSILIDMENAITSLQQEQPERPLDLDNAAQDYVRDYFCPSADFTPEYIKHLMEDAFVGGATWKAERLTRHEQPDLEAEIYKLYDGEYHDTEDVARHFYELGRNTR